MTIIHTTHRASWFRVISCNYRDGAQPFLRSYYSPICQEILHLLWKLKIHYNVQKILPMVPTDA
jgi:hypothetical protein